MLICIIWQNHLCHFKIYRTFMSVYRQPWQLAAEYTDVYNTPLINDTMHLKTISPIQFKRQHAFMYKYFK